MLHTVLLIIHFFCAMAIVALVLLQRGKGAEAGAGFGAGASGTVFGARGASTALSRATAILAGLFMATSLSLAYVGTRKAASSSLLDQYSQQAPSAPANSAAPNAPAPNTPAPNATQQPDATQQPAPAAAPAPSGSTPAPGK
jgi:preprotein translocase subunit SecG